MLTTGCVIVLAVSLTTYLNVKDFESVFEERVAERMFKQAGELQKTIEESIELGRGLKKLDGINNECKSIVLKLDYAEYCFVTDNRGEVYYHNLPDKVGAVYADPVSKKALSAGKNIVQYYRQAGVGGIYDFSGPFTRPGKEQMGVVRLGIRSAVVGREVSRWTRRAVALGVTFIIISNVILFFLFRHSVLIPVGKIMK